MPTVAQDTARGGQGEPASNIAVVTPSDTDELTHVSRALWIGATGGDVEVVTLGGQTVVISAIPAGTILPIRVKQVKAGSTTATSILNLY